MYATRPKHLSDISAILPLMVLALLKSHIYSFPLRKK